MRSKLAIAALILSTAPLADEPVRESGLVESTGRRLVQLDVTVRGPREAIADLTREEFEVSIGGHEIESFTLDNLCRLPAEPARHAEPPAATGSEPVAPAEPAAPAARAAVATFLFYFDQRQLTPGGRQRALDLARELASELIRGGNRAMVVSAGRDVKVFARMTDDAAQVRAALDEIEGDRMQWDPQEAVFASEESRIEQVVDALNDGDLDEALSLARQFQKEETWRTGKALRLFSLTVARLADADPPKAVLYFADTMRSNAGEHYLSFFSSGTRRGTDENTFKQMEMDSFTAGASFQQAIEEASAQGVRVYTVQAEGLVMSSPRLTVTDSARAGRTTAGYNSQRIRDAQSSLTSLAHETGGDSFLNGVAADKIAGSIRDDLACLYLISFDPAGLPEDRDLPVNVRSTRRKVELQVKGLLVIQSERERRASRLLAAFAAPEAGSAEGTVAAKIVPTGYADGEFSALVQLAVPGSELPDTVWDLGVSLVSRGRVREDAAGRVSVSGAGVPVVFETQMHFAPGPFELIGVAHETKTDAIATGRLEDAWPDPDSGAATVGPIAVLQPNEGAFLRDTEFRGSGALALGPAELLRTDRPTALVGIVCRGAGKHRLRIERSLSGDSAASFVPQDLDLATERCALFADRIPAGTMTSGSFRYEVRVIEDDAALATAVREFAVVTDDELSGPVTPPAGAS